MARYRRIDPYIWHDDKFPSFSDDAKLLFFHLLTTPRGNPLGCFVQGKSDMAEYLGWSAKRFAIPFAELLSSRRIEYDEKTRLVLIPRYLHYNPLENENQAKMACKYLSELPLNNQYFQHLKQYMEQLAVPYAKPLVDALANRIGNGMPNTEPYPFLSEPQPFSSEPYPPVVPQGDLLQPAPQSLNGWGTPEALMALYNDACPPECPAAETLSPKRREKAKRLLRAFPDQAYWQEAFKEVHRSTFLRGMCAPSKGHSKAFVASFDWLLSCGKDGTENIVQVWERKYGNQT